MIKEEIYSIFNQVQNNEEISKNLQALVKLCEVKRNLDKVLQSMDEVFKIVLFNYETGMDAFTHIKEFIKSFIDSILKCRKEDIPKTIINHFCIFFCQEPRKSKIRSVMFFFLTTFVMPYIKFPHFYLDDTLEDIKEAILSCLCSKMGNIQELGLNLLKKVPYFQKNKEIKLKMEELLSSSSVKVKRDILGLIDLTDKNKLDYLIEMHDDESGEIRLFVYEKLSMLQISQLDSATKIKLFFIGLSDPIERNRNSARKVLKHYMVEQGILDEKFHQLNTGSTYKNIKSNQMELDDDQSNTNKSFTDEGITAKEKLEYVTSPLKVKQVGFTNLASRILDDLHVSEFYNHSKYSSCFELLVESIIDMSDLDSLKSNLNLIIENLELYNYPIYNNENILPNLNNSNLGESAEKRGDASMILVLSDVMFLQLSILYSVSSKPRSNELKELFYDKLPTMLQFTGIINYFYKKVPNLLIMHQLLLILQMDALVVDQDGTRALIELIRTILMDIKLDRISISDIKLVARNLNASSQAREDNEDDEEEQFKQLMNSKFENTLLPTHRKMISTASDLLDDVMMINFKLSPSNPMEFFHSMNQIMSDLNDNIDPDAIEPEDQNKINMSLYQIKQSDLNERLKEKITEIDMLQEMKEKKKGNRNDIERKIMNETMRKEQIELEIEEIIIEEKSTYLRVLKIAEFVIKYCKVAPKRK